MLNLYIYLFIVVIFFCVCLFGELFLLLHSFLVLHIRCGFYCLPSNICWDIELEILTQNQVTYYEQYLAIDKKKESNSGLGKKTKKKQSILTIRCVLDFKKKQLTTTNWLAIFNYTRTHKIEPLFGVRTHYI